MDNLKKKKHQGASQNVSSIAGILRHSNTQNEVRFKELEESLTPQFSSRQAIPNIQVSKPYTLRQNSKPNSRQNSRQNIRQSSKAKADKKKPQSIEMLNHNMQRRLSKQRNPLKKNNSDINNVYREDNHRRLFKSVNTQPTQASSLHSSQQIPVGAATIFKSTIFSKPNVSDYLTCESTDEDPYKPSSNERPKKSFVKPEALQYSHISDNVFNKQAQWPNGGLSYSVSDLTNNRVDMDALKAESKAILLEYMDPKKTLHGADVASIPSHQILEIGIIIPQKDDIMDFMEKRCSFKTDPADLYDLILVAIDKIQYVIKTIQDNGVDFSLEDIVQQAVNLACLEYKMQLREKQKMLAMKSDHESMSHLFKESNLQGTDGNLLEDLDILNANLKDMSNDARSFVVRDQQRRAAIDKLQKDIDQIDQVPSKQSKSDNDVPKKKQFVPTLLLASQKDKNFKLLFKYMRAWSYFVAQKKESRIAKEYLETQLVSSIHRSDISRMQKAMRALLLNRMRKKGARRACQIIEMKRAKNVERLYFKQLHKKYVRRQKFKEIKVMINRYRTKRLAKASLIGWNKYVFQIRHQQLTKFEQAMLRARYAPEVLLELVAAPYFLKAIGSTDCNNILNFHALAHTQFRQPDQSYQAFIVDPKTGHRKMVPGPIRLRKHNVAIFQRTIEHILQYKQLRVIKALQSYVKLQKEFRYKQRQRQLRFIFESILQESDICKLLREAHVVKNQRKTAIIFDILRKNALRKKNLREKGEIIQEKRRKAFEQKHFIEWSAVFHYHYRIHYGETSIPEREADLIYLNRYFICLKEYTAVQKWKKPLKKNAERHFFNNRASKAFQILKQHRKKSQKLKRIISRVEKNHRHEIKLKYFQQYRRMFYLVANSRIQQNRRLQQKVLASFRKRRMYKIMKQKVIRMAYQKYYDNLLIKGFNSLRKNRNKRLEMRAIMLGYQVGFSKLMMQKAFKGLKTHVEKVKAKKMQLKYLDRLNTGNTIEKCFTNWLYFSRRQKRIRQAYNEIKTHRDQKTRTETLLQMLILYNRKKLTKQLYDELSESHQKKVIQRSFEKWFARHKHLREAEKLYTEMREVQCRQDLFNLWRMRFLVERQNKERLAAFAIQKEERLLKDSFTALKDQCREHAHRREMKKLCAFIFLKNLLKKSFHQLRYNQFYLQTKRRVPYDYIQRLKSKVFQRLKFKWFKNKRAIDNRRNRTNRSKVQVFQNLKANYLYNKRVRMNFIQLMMDKDVRAQQQCFDALKNWRHRKKELIQKNLPIYFLDEEYFKANFVLKHWKMYHGERMRLKRAHDALEAQRKARTVQAYMDWWREQVYQRQLHNLKALPFHETVVQANMKRQVFNALMANQQVQQEQKESFRRAFEFYRFQLLQKSMEIMKWNRERKQSNREKVEFLQVQKDNKVKQLFFERLKHRTAKNLKYREEYEIQKERSDQFRKQYFFILWYRNFYKSQQLRPVQSVVSRFYARSLMRRALKKLYNNRTMGILKNNMLETALGYRSENLKKKVFEQLLFHTYKTKTKGAMQKLADMHFKRNLIMKWLMVTQQRLQAKDALENYNFSPRATRSALGPPLVHQGTGLSTLSHGKSIVSGIDGRQSTVTDNDDIKIDELDSTGEILAAHNALEQQMLMLSQISSPSSSRLTPSLYQGSAANPQKKVLQEMMMKLKERYKQIKERKETDKQSRTDAILSKRNGRNVTSEDMEKMADDLKDKHLQKRALYSLSVYSNDKIDGKDKEVQARSFRNIQLKQKALNQLKFWTRQRVQNREAVAVFHALRAQRTKKKVLHNLRNHKNKTIHKMLQKDIAAVQYRQFRISMIFHFLQKRGQMSKNASKLAQRWDQRRVQTHFLAWLAAANDSVERRDRDKSPGQNWDGDHEDKTDSQEADSQRQRHVRFEGANNSNENAFQPEGGSNSNLNESAFEGGQHNLDLGTADLQQLGRLQLQPESSNDGDEFPEMRPGSDERKLDQLQHDLRQMIAHDQQKNQRNHLEDLSRGELEGPADMTDQDDEQEEQSQQQQQNSQKESSPQQTNSQQMKKSKLKYPTQFKK